jgi:two-component system, NtrC family, sensor kinase
LKRVQGSHLKFCAVPPLGGWHPNEHRNGVNSQPKSDESKVEPAAEKTHQLLDSLARERNVLRTMIDLMPAFVYAKDIHSRFIAANARLAKYMGTTPAGLIGKTDFDFYPLAMAEKFFADEQNLIKSGVPLIDHEELVYDKERDVERVFLTSKIHLRDADGRPIGIVGTGVDITEHKAAEKRTAAGERLESIGRIAAGVTHEINTPIQFLKDTLSFLSDGMQEMTQYIDELRATHSAPPKSEVDFEGLRAEIPPALERMADGLSRIAEIVRSMKEFSHSDRREMSPVDLNRAIKSTLVIARGEYRYVADVETVFAPLPLVLCHGGQVSQVVLNLVVNAAHAIGDVFKTTGVRGKITVSTRIEGDRVVIAIEDTGGGIPDAVRARIFEPFFTTKELGRGTGQGLSIARNAIVKDHGGSLDFETQPGKGTTFFVRLPLEPLAEESLAATGT